MVFWALKNQTDFEGVKIETTTHFPVTTGVEIPAVTITIELKETYIANSGTESLLTFDSNTLGKTKKNWCDCSKSYYWLWC